MEAQSELLTTKVSKQNTLKQNKLGIKKKLSLEHFSDFKALKCDYFQLV